ncbi:MAG: NAD(P)-dependent alcohol dehydrogenase [Archangium sp.]
MRAMVLDEYGMAPKVVELPAPKPGAGDVLVRVKATSVNPIDWKQGSGKGRPILRAKFPNFIPGYDVAGVVDALGSGISKFKVGDRVHVRLSGTQGGANAELISIPVDELVPLPDALDFAQGAALPLAGMTALQGLRDGCDLPTSGAAQRVLVIGASGGVGHFAVQIARSAGAHVTGVCSTPNVELVRSLGAHEVVDYKSSEPWKGITQPFDCIFDTIGSSPGEYLEKLTEKGVFASCLPGPGVFANAALNLIRGRSVRPVLLSVKPYDLAVLDELAVRGQLRAVIDSRYQAEALAQAWAHSATGRTAGKIVVDW